MDRPKPVEHESRRLGDTSTVHGLTTTQAAVSVRGGQGMPYYPIDKDVAARKDLTGNDKLIYAIITEHQGQNERAWPGVRKMEQESGLTRKTIIACIRHLETAGCLTVERGKTGSRAYYRVVKSGVVLAPTGGDSTPVPAGKAVESLPRSGVESPKSGVISPKSGVESPPEQPQKKPQKKTKGTTSAAGNGVPPFAQIRIAWNQMAGDELPNVRQLTQKRKAMIRVRWRDEDWRANWLQAMQRVRRSPFLMGGGKKGWRADFDFFIKPDTLTKILEGKYESELKRERCVRQEAEGRASQRAERADDAMTSPRVKTLAKPVGKPLPDEARDAAWKALPAAERKGLIEAARGPKGPIQLSYGVGERIAKNKWWQKQVNSGKGER